MKNVEKYSHKIAELLSIKCTGESNCDECPYDEFCSQIGGSSSQIEDWLFEEYQESIELTQFEYDLIHALANNGGKNYEFKYTVCDNLKKEKGYFKGIQDTNMTLADILGNCWVIVCGKNLEKLDCYGS